MAKGFRPTQHAPDPSDDKGDKPFDIIAGLGQSPDWKEELTRELLDQLIVCARIGGFRKQTALACHVRPTTLETWITEGMRADAPPLYRELSVRYQATRSQLTMILVGVIAAAAQNGDWQAALALLSKMDTDWSGSTKEVDVNSPQLSAEQRKELLIEALKDRRDGLDDVLTKAGYPRLPAP